MIEGSYRRSASCFLGLLLLAGCAGSRSGTSVSGTAASSESQQPAAVETEEAGMELVGTLAPTVEAGGWVLNTEKKTYLLLRIEKYRQQEWFQEGARVRVRGEESPDTVTIFMQGMPFKVQSMEPAEEEG